MADAVVRQILDLIVVATTGLPTTGTRVFESQIEALGADDLPCLVVEPAVVQPPEVLDDTHNEPNQRLERRFFAATVTTLAFSATERDESAKEVEHAVAAIVIPPGYAPHRRIEFNGSEYEVRMAGEGQTERPLFACQSSYQAVYLVRSNAVDAVL